MGIMEQGYKATAAGYDIHVSYTDLSLCMHGFTTNCMPDSFQMLIKFMSSFEAPEGHCNTAKEQLNQSYSNLLLKSIKY
uniref:Peptidase M16 middle/third domain-containing protein n=1 Tax=Amphimedon queenslandica TaxID=400682 RepID=A0A1X7UVQ4_AMPQE